jgi:glycosyltransferase involved in cell wall biosynthesis
VLILSEEFEITNWLNISNFRFLFISSLWKEGFVIVLAEALKSSCYCIASNQGGIHEVLQFGKIGRSLTTQISAMNGLLQ